MHARTYSKERLLHTAYIRSDLRYGKNPVISLSLLALDPPLLAKYLLAIADPVGGLECLCNADVEQSRFFLRRRGGNLDFATCCLRMAFEVWTLETGPETHARTTTTNVGLYVHTRAGRSVTTQKTSHQRLLSLLLLLLPRSFVCSSSSSSWRQTTTMMTSATVD